VHAVCSLCGAGREQLVLALYGNKTHATVADDRELGIPAKGGNLNSCRARRIQDRRAVGRGDGFAVDIDRRRHATNLEAAYPDGKSR
jgi:hypothetical protein